MSIKLTPHQQEVNDNIIRNLTDETWGLTTCSLTGPAGSGKTTLTKIIVQHLKDLGYKIAITAPTHQAVEVIRNTIGIQENKNVMYGTIHSFLNLKPGEIDEITGERKFQKIRFKKWKKPDPDKGVKFGDFWCNVLIIDESSMISTELKKFISDEVGTRYDKVFYLGDSFQLLAVDEEIKNNQSPIFDDNQIVNESLTEVIRQSDNELIDFLSEIRGMIERKASKRDLINFLKREKKKEHKKIKFFDSISEFIKNYARESEKNPNKRIVIGTFTNAKVDNYNNSLHRYFKKTDEELVEGDIIVIQGTHTDEKGNLIVQNSEIIKINTIDRDYRGLTQGNSRFIDILDIEGENVLGHKKKFSIIPRESKEYVESYLKILAKNKDWHTFYQIKDKYVTWKHKYASTIHKLQGSSVDTIYIDLRYIQGDADMLLRLAYVGFSRCRENIRIIF